MATRTTTRLHGTRDEAGKSVRAFQAAGGAPANISAVGSGRDGASGGAGIGATLGTLLGGGAGLMAGIGALPIPGAGPVVAAGWLVAVLTGAAMGAGVGAAAGGLLGSLTGAGGDEEDAHVRAEAAPRRGTALPARAEEAEAARLEAVSAAGGQVDAAPRRTGHEAADWNRPGPAASDRTASGAQAERKRRVRVHGGGAHATADAEAHRGAEEVQQADSSTSDAPLQGAEATADTVSGVQAERKRRVHVHGAHAAADVAAHQAVLRGGCSTGEALRQGDEATADADRQGSEAEAEPARRGARAVVEGQRRIAQDLAEPAGGVSREVAEAARDTTEEARRVAAPPDAAEGRQRDLQQGVAGMFEGVVRANLRIAQEMFRLGDPAPIVELQQRFAREYTDTLLRNSATLARTVRRTADETLRPLERRIERQQRGPANENDPRLQPAAE